VYEFGYFTPYTGHAQTITDSSVKLHRDLEHDQVFETHKKVVFVAHSMGGIILRKFLIDNQQAVQDKVAMMYFFATPTDGAELATIAKKLSNNPQVGGLAVSQTPPATALVALCAR
jgi:triacylglycerol esterase/lipase EstA (alpha/beta hydrolase family)